MSNGRYYIAKFWGNRLDLSKVPQIGRSGVIDIMRALVSIGVVSNHTVDDIISACFDPLPNPQCTPLSLGIKNQHEPNEPFLLQQIG